MSYHIMLPTKERGEGIEMIGALSQRWVIAVIILLLSSLVGLSDSRAARADTPGVTSLKNTIVVGRVSGNPRKTYPRLESFAKYLAHRLRSLGIKKGQVIIAKNNYILGRSSRCRRLCSVRFAGRYGEALDAPRLDSRSRTWRH